jgi:HPt (histidine-containing phosphotransfer) domain-containing protein
MITTNTCGNATKPLVDLEQLQSTSDGDSELMRELLDLYFKQAEEIMGGLGKGIETGDVKEVNHLSHKLAGSSLACGMSAVVPPLRQLEETAKAGHLRGATDSFAQAGAQLEAVRQYVYEHLQQHPH